MVTDTQNIQMVTYTHFSKQKIFTYVIFAFLAKRYAQDVKTGV